MKKLAKLIMISALVACIATSFAGCSDSSAKTSGGDTTGTTTESQGNTNDKKEADTPKSDGKGYTFKDAAVEAGVRSYAMNTEMIKNESDPITEDMLKKVTNLFLHYNEADGDIKVKSLEDVAMMPELIDLNINYQDEVTDISALKNCPKLFGFYAINAPISDISALSNCNELRFVDVTGSNVTDLSPLAGKAKIQEISAPYAKIEKIDFTGMTDLKEVTLTENNISDISTVSGAPNLEVLMLNDNPVTDISAVGSCKLLRQIYIDNSLVTDVSVLTNCKDLSAISMKNVKADYKMLDNKEVLPKILTITI